MSDVASIDATGSAGALRIDRMFLGSAVSIGGTATSASGFRSPFDIADMLFTSIWRGLWVSYTLPRGQA